MNQHTTNRAWAQLHITDGYWFHFLCVPGKLGIEIGFSLLVWYTRDWNQKGKPVWILMKQELMGGSVIIWTTCKSFALCFRPITTTPCLNSQFLLARSFFWCSTCSVKAPKALVWYVSVIIFVVVRRVDYIHYCHYGSLLTWLHFENVLTSVPQFYSSAYSRIKLFEMSGIGFLLDGCTLFYHPTHCMKALKEICNTDPNH